jgi:hypothetical protein
VGEGPDLEMPAGGVLSRLQLMGPSHDIIPSVQPEPILWARACRISGKPINGYTPALADPHEVTSVNFISSRPWRSRF